MNHDFRDPIMFLKWKTKLRKINFKKFATTLIYFQMFSTRIKTSFSYFCYREKNYCSYVYMLLYNIMLLCFLL